MNWTELQSLYREAADQTVLSVYIDADQNDPALRDIWATRLRKNMARAKAASGDSHEDLAAFERAAEHIEKAIGVDGESYLPGKGWVGFSTADGLLSAESVSVPMADLVRWELGLRVAPYLRVVEAAQPTWLVLADARKARIHVFEKGAIKLLQTLEAQTVVGDLSDVGTRKRAAERTGIRGKTSTDAAEATLEESAIRLFRRVVEEVPRDVGTVVLGGPPERVAALAEIFDTAGSRVHQKVVRDPSLHFGMTDTELRSAVERVREQRVRGRRAQEIESLLEKALAPGGRGTLGRSDTEKALLEARVRTLFISETLADADPDYADRVVGTAFGRCGAPAHVVREAEAERLDEMGDGIGALVHYTVSPQSNGESS